MSYVVAAYGITVLTFVVYALHLHRENRRLADEERDGA
jgi:heme exporter protein D